MALIDPSGDTIANTTDYARELIARATLGLVVFKVVGFGLGRGGYNPSDVVQPLPLNLAATELSDKVFPTATPFDYEPFISTEQPTSRACVYNCRVGSSVVAGPADYGLGELALYGEIIKSDVPSEIGQVFLFAVSHFPLFCKTRRDTLLRRVVVTY